MTMTAYGLMKAHMKAFPKSHYFDRDTLKFFGERLSEMYVLKSKAIIEDSLSEKHTCYILSKSSKGQDGKRRRTYGYFDTETFEEVVPRVR